MCKCGYCNNCKMWGIKAGTNKLDQLIERKAYELFTAQGFSASLVEFKIKELLIIAARGYNSRAEIISLIKRAANA